MLASWRVQKKATAGKYWLILLICCQNEETEDFFCLFRFQLVRMPHATHVPFTQQTVNHWWVNVSFSCIDFLSSRSSTTSSLTVKGSAYLVSFVFTLFNTASLSDLSGTLGGILGGESRAAALVEREGRGGGGQISAMSFKKNEKKQTNISNTSDNAKPVWPVNQYSKACVTATAHTELQLESLIKTHLLCFYLPST